MKALRTWVLWVGLVVAACGGASSVSSNSETHFLGLCSANECGEGLSCICGVCTVTCDPAASCGALNANAICTTPSSSSCGDDTQPSVCDVDCDDDSECASLGDDFRCLAGVCRPPGCVHEGRIYQEGARFDNDCNTCTCRANGELTCTRIACEDGCEYDGQRYALGENFPDRDGCNTCTCTEDGVACTDAACAGTCEYNGTTYDIGDDFPATDGCNHCSCSEDGVLCSEIGCVGPTCEYSGGTYTIGDEFPADDTCNTCTCTVDGVVCTDAACTGCQVGDRFYDYGDSYLAEDGCNTCSCSEEGSDCSQAGCSRPACVLPFDAGECLASMPVFYYDAQAARCLEEIYGGCGGNENRFETLEDCQLTCREFDNGD